MKKGEAMNLKHYEDFASWHDALMDGADNPGVDVVLNLSKGPTPDELREAADLIEISCCGTVDDIAVVDGDVYYRFIDFGH